MAKTQLRVAIVRHGKGLYRVAPLGTPAGMAHGPAAATRHAARPGFFHIHIDQS